MEIPFNKLKEKIKINDISIFGLKISIDYTN